MYSRKNREEYIITPPPGYDGSRFGSRSDGRDDSFPPYNKEGQMYTKEEKTPCEEPCKESHLPQVLKNRIGQEELLLIALLIVIVGEKSVSPEIILLLGLLLCI